MTRIVVVDYGLGNLGSVLKAFRHVGAPAELTADPARRRRADALVLPGDAAFGTAMGENRRHPFEHVELSAVNESGDATHQAALRCDGVDSAL